MECDLSSEEDILSMFLALCSQHSGVDICINNAGLAWPDTLLSGNTSSWKDMFNEERLEDLLKALSVLVLMGQGCGLAGALELRYFFRPLFDEGVNMLALSICTREAYQSMKEWKVDDGHIININSCISPEVVETQFSFKLHNKDPEKAASIYERIKCLKPEDVAEAVIYVLKHPSTCPGEEIGDIQMRSME
ncbi:dehydrogenase/reductase SDR family member 11 [Prionailurus iriomotensis]